MKKSTILDQVAERLALGIINVAAKTGVTDEQLQMALGYVAGQMRHEHTLTDLDLIDKAADAARAKLDERCHCAKSKGTSARNN